MRPGNDPIPAELVAAAQAGDPRALRALYENIRPFVAYVIGALAGYTADFDELCSDVCAEVLLSIGRYRGEGHFNAWVWAVVARQIGSWRKRRRLDRMLTRQVEHQPPPNAAVPRPDEVLVWQESRWLVGREILRLPKRMYLAVTLLDLAEMTPSEVARLIGGTPRSITNASYRAKLRIQERLAAAGLVDPDARLVAPILGGPNRSRAAQVPVRHEAAEVRGVEHDVRD